jgi:hypothetical protein
MSTSKVVLVELSASPSLLEKENSVTGEGYEETSQIYRMMAISDKTLLSHAMVLDLVKDKNIRNRAFMVEWMMREVRKH